LFNLQLGACQVRRKFSAVWAYIPALLHYGGERILDRQNLFVREAVQRVAQRVVTGLEPPGICQP